MGMVTNDRNSGAALQYGVMFIPGLAMGYPDLVPMVQKIFSDRIAKLPWVPSTWLEGVQKLQSDYPEDLVTIAPSRRAKTDATGRWVGDNGPASAQAPLFLDDDAKLDAWMSIYSDLNSARSKYAAAQAAAGRRELDALYAKAAFWDGAYRIAVFVRDAPGKAIGAVGAGIFDFAGSMFKNITGKSLVTWIILGILVICGVWFWLRPESFLRVTKLGSLLKLAKG